MVEAGFYSTVEWREFRARALDRADYRCEAEEGDTLDGEPVRCTGTRRLHVHHEHDVALDEQDGIVFCPGHHCRWHVLVGDRRAVNDPRGRRARDAGSAIAA